MTAPDLTGTAVQYDGDTYTYGGPMDRPHPGATSIAYDLRYGRTPVITCDPRMVCPADVPLVDAKDPRITVVKLPRKREGMYDGGLWLATVPGDSPTRRAKATKRAAVESARARLTVADWWAQQ